MNDPCTLIAHALGQRPDSPVVRELLTRYPNLQDLAESTPEELKEIPGIGPARARQLHAIFQLGRSSMTHRRPESIMITSPEEAAAVLMPRLRHRDREVFETILLNTKHRIITIDTVSVGTLSSVAVHPREVFRPAIRRLTAAVILAHNHPSGDPSPSPEDVALTKRLMQAGHILGINVLDHIIIGDGRWISLRAEGYV